LQKKPGNLESVYVLFFIAEQCVLIDVAFIDDALIDVTLIDIAFITQSEIVE